MSESWLQVQWLDTTGRVVHAVDAADQHAADTMLDANFSWWRPSRPVTVVRVVRVTHHTETVRTIPQGGNQ